MYSLNEIHTMQYLEALDTTNTLHECPFAQRLNYVIVFSDICGCYICYIIVSKHIKHSYMMNRR